MTAQLKASQAMPPEPADAPGRAANLDDVVKQLRRQGGVETQAQTVDVEPV